ESRATSTAATQDLAAWSTTFNKLRQTVVTNYGVAGKRPISADCNRLEFWSDECTVNHVRAGVLPELQQIVQHAQKRTGPRLCGIPNHRERFLGKGINTGLSVRSDDSGMVQAPIRQNPCCVEIF